MAEIDQLRREQRTRGGGFLWEFRKRGSAAAAAWIAYDHRQRRLLTEAYVAHQPSLELPGVETTIDLHAMTHTVRGVAERFEVRGRLDEGFAPLAPLAVLAPIVPETFEGRALRTGEVVRRRVLPARVFTQESEHDRHFRLAEAQFMRMGGGHNVVAVDVVMNPTLLRAFEAKQRAFVERDGRDSTILSFHGTTSEANIENILARNFDIGRLAANTGNRGHYGAGIYFSEHASVAAGYARGQVRKVLLCKLLVGREYTIGGAHPTGPNPGVGAGLVAGFDSHVVHGTRGTGHEIVIFDDAQILPCYVIHWS
jgi:hypothetical protein